MMMRRETRQPKWLLIACLLNSALFNCCNATSFENKTGNSEMKTGPRVFSPRMDYDEWTPLGRGDPLKNDPTFDYVPPILDRVQYWMDTHTTEAAASKSDILVLGVTAKKTSPKIPEQYLKFANFNGPKFIRNQEVQSGYTSDFTGSRGAEPPSVVRKTPFRNVPKDYRNQERIESIPASYYPSSFYENPKPETFMMPPPPVIRNPDRPHHGNKNHLYSEKHRFGTQTEAGPVHQMKYQSYDHPQSGYSQSGPQKPPRIHYNQAAYERQKMTTKETPPEIAAANSHESTTASVSSEKSNLIYQSSSHSVSNGWFAKTRHPNQPPTIPSANNRDYPYEEDVHQAAGSSHHQVVLGPNANIIVEPETSEDEIVIGHKESSYEALGDQEDEPELVTAPEEPSTESMFIVLANSSPSPVPKEESAVTFLMPESLEIGSNGTEEATVFAEIEKATEFRDPVEMKEIPKHPAERVPVMPYRVQETMPPIGESAFYHQPSHPRPAQMMHQKPNRIPTMTQRPLPNVPAADGMKPNIRFPVQMAEGISTNLKPGNDKHDRQSITTSSPINAIRDLLLKHDSPKVPEVETTSPSHVEVTSTTIRAIPSTTSPTLTTDPIFSHYKQPANPMRGPMYLIIQGHSKVKTYKPWVDKRANEIDIESTTKKRLSDFENFVKENTQKIAEAGKIKEAKTTERPKEKTNRQDSLLSFIDSGLGSFLSSPDAA